MKRWSRRPDGSNWGDFGDEDQIGRLNLITPERRLAALREVRDGRVFPLSLPLDLPGAALQPGPRQGRAPRLEWTVGPSASLDEVFRIRGAVDLGNDDRVMLTLQYSTQWDALSHVGALFDADGDGIPEKVYYNGYRAERDMLGSDRTDACGFRALGIETMAATCVQGRGVLINLLKRFGREPRIVGYELLMSVIEEQEIMVEPGDLLCLYTGYGDAVLASRGESDVAWIEESFAAFDGQDPRLLQWITDSGIAAICADNGAVEAKPKGHASGTAHCAPGTPFLPLHHHCLFKLGVFLGELWYFGELAPWLDRTHRSRFLLTAPPLRLPGAVGSPVMPVATV